MDNKYADRLIRKTGGVILSCESIHQLKIAIEFAGLAYREISKEPGLLSSSGFTCKVERFIGFAQCKIKYGIKYSEIDTNELNPMGD